MSNPESGVTSTVRPDGLPPTTCPRLYQSELFEEAKRRNIIIRADTGTGKTLVAVMLIGWMATQVQPKPDNERHVLQAFLVPTCPLVQQQAQAIRKGTGLRVREYSGELQLELWNVRKWSRELQATDVIVCTAQIFYALLSKGLWSLEDVSLLVFDEAHHCRKNHVYNQIMQVHYRRLAQDPYYRRVPKILGLTASPIWDLKDMTTAEVDIKALQSELSAHLYEIKESCDDVAQYTKKPKEKIVSYAPVTFLDQLSEPHLEEVQALVNVHADSKFLLSSRAIQEELGQYAHLIFLSDWLSDLLSPSTDSNTLTANPRLLEPDYRKKVQETIKTLHSLIDPNTVPLNQTTPKVRALIGILQGYSNDDANFHGIVFVERRLHAQLLHCLISRCAVLKGFIKSGSLTGHASSGPSIGCDSGMSCKAQHRVVENFRTGEMNLAIATNVAEEGLDFQACRVVIRFDDINTWKGYIQSRGRSRAADSDYVVMQLDGSSSKYLQFAGKEEKLRTKLYDRAEDEDIKDAPLESTPQLINSLSEGKDAILTHSGAVSLLHEVCQLLPPDKDADIPKPEFQFIQCANGFKCQLTLPPMPALTPADRFFESNNFPNKKEAKQSVCFNACHALHKFGVLDEHFIPQREHLKPIMRDAEKGNESILTHSRAVSLLHDACHLLPHTKCAGIPGPQFEDIQQPKGFQCRITLPPMLASSLADRVLVSDTFPKKKEAKQSACFKACQALREAGVLDQDFMPQHNHRYANTTYAEGLKDPVLTHHAAVGLLNEFCQRLPHDQNPGVPEPQFEYSQCQAGFVCRVTLPPMPALTAVNGVFDSDAFPNKKSAKKSACFKACQALGQAGALDRFIS